VIKFLYILIAIELFVGGGGRMLELGPITVRMVLFVAGLSATVFLLLNRFTDRGAVSLAMLLVAGFIATHFPALLIGWFKGSAPGDIFTDVSPLLYWLIAPFFAIVLAHEKMVLRTAQLIQVTAIAMALIYLVIVAGLATEHVNFSEFYEWADMTGEIAFRNESLFLYKGFLYFGIGAIFLVALGGGRRNFWLSIVLIALILTLTRGFILATGMAGILLLCTMGRWRAVLVAACLAAFALFAVWVYLPSLDEGYMLEQRGISNSIRLDDLSFIVENVSLSALLFGEGFGSYINGRLAIESSYLMILWKTGLVGLVFWLVPFGIAMYYFRRVRAHAQHYRLACAFFFGVLLVYVQTGSNPYLNNPIGLSFVIMGIFSLRAISRIESASKVSSLSAVSLLPTPMVFRAIE
jgi:hypothetical protein